MKKTIAILGGGESGVGAAILAKAKGYNVFVSDRGNLKSNYKLELEKHGIPYEEGQHSEDRIFEATEVIKSPGIPDKVALIQALKAKAIPVISEIEFASRYTEDAIIIGITGSNGKTTTTNLMHHMLHEAGKNAIKCGNVGKSLARCIAEGGGAYYVIELSSFQLDGIVNFKPNYAVLLNITPDHLDRYEYQLDLYARSKFRIGMNQSAEDVLILNDNLIESIQRLDLANQLTTNKLAVSSKFDSTEVLKVDTSEFDMRNSSLKGPHNFFNASCAIAIAQKLGLSEASIQLSLTTFVNDPHRLESVATINGVEYINDSKATNLDSVNHALQAMTKPVVLIAGGTDKGNDYSIIEDIVAQKVKALICMGVDNTKLLEHFSSMIKIIEETKSAAEAVERATIYAETGDVVLLSPACASFDLFDNYIDRGEKFIKAVKELVNEKANGKG